MKVKLRVVQGTLQNRKGEDAGVAIAIRRSSFVIGSSDDANMRCLSKAISPRHCELIRDDEQITVRDLESETGTFLNGDRLIDIRQLQRRKQCLTKQWHAEKRECEHQEDQANKAAATHWPHLEDFALDGLH